MQQDQQDAVVTLAIAGDVGIRRSDPKSIFAQVADVLSAADVTLVNQEWPLTDQGAPWPGKTGKLIGSTPEAVEALTFAGVDVVSLANNHMLNYGNDGMFLTLHLLDEAGIAHAGAGADLASAHRHAIVKRKGTRFAVLSYTSVFPAGWEATPDRPGLATVRIHTEYTPYHRADEMPGSPHDIKTIPNADDVAQLERDIRTARADADIVIIMWHWGVSMGYQHLVPYQKELGHFVIDAGADILVGHHPHTLQPIEIYRGKPICYSIAQFGFDLESDKTSPETVLLQFDVRDRELANFYVRPAMSLMNGDIKFAEGAEARAVIEWVKRLCRPFGTPIVDEGDRLRVELPVPSLVA